MIDQALYDEAAKAEAPVQVRVNFGVMDVDLYRCVLIRGEGKVLYNPDVHSEDQKRTAVDLTLNPVASARYHDPIKRELIAQSKEWTQIVRPSLQAIGLDLQSLSGRWVQTEMVPTGRTFTNQNGEVKQLTTFKFVAVFPNEAACEAASQAFFARIQSNSAAESPASTSGSASTVGAQNGTASSSAPDASRGVAAKFLPAMFKQANGDVDKFIQLIQANSLTSKFFSLDSPEVIAVVSGQAA